MIIYKKYKQPPEPPKHLWLIIDLKKLKFNTNQDLDYIKNYVIRYNPELYTEINKIYKIHYKIHKKIHNKIHNKIHKKKRSYSNVNKYDLIETKIKKKKNIKN